MLIVEDVYYDDENVAIELVDRDVDGRRTDGEFRLALDRRVALELMKALANLLEEGDE
jgi:hypothetical protein